MTLNDIINKVDFNKVFADILRHVPEAEDKRALFRLAFDTLRSSHPCKGTRCEIEAMEKDYLGEGVHDLWINASAIGSDIGDSLLAGRIRLNLIFNRPDAVRKTSDEMIVADLLWQLVAYGFPNDSAFLSGFILNNRRWPESTISERIEEICSYIDLHKVSELPHEAIRRYSKAKNIAWATNITPYSLPQIKASYDMNCFLDDFMWFNNETRTIVIISSSEGYESETCKIEEFVNSMLKNPTTVHGKPLLPGIEIMAIFITER